ncbi:MAG: hypothetical protein GWO24_21000, partial [Akkermansiaceae bacterium]|nr:hypothetical protein [Akkermansiaceae bacterium]
SDTPVWSADGKLIYYTARVGDGIELFQVDLAGESKRLTHSPAATSHYHPKPTRDGKWLIYGSKRKGARNVFARELKSGTERQLTHLKPGHAAMWAQVSNR